MKKTDKRISGSGYWAGNSLSGCVLSILRGEIHLNNVGCIVSGTKMFDMCQALCYSDTYWREYTEEQIWDVLKAIWPRLVQPRNWGHTPPNTSGMPRWRKLNTKHMDNNYNYL
jgi:hypothetical protein